MGEFELIYRHFAHLGAERQDVELSVGDDCALLDIPMGEVLAVTTDTLVSGTHFFPDVDPFTLGQKALAVNLSDLAAMGAEPKWFSLALTLPDTQTPWANWVEQFAQGMAVMASRWGVQLIGGDTTGGPLSVTISAKGTVPAHLALRRSAAKVGDLIYVSGSLGAAALGVFQRLKPMAAWRPEQASYCQKKMELPQPRCALGLKLRGIAHSALDISDGLAGDLIHILKASGVAAHIELSHVPIDQVVTAVCSQPQAWQVGLGGGDDYELCFTIPPEMADSVARLATEIDLPLTCIGAIVAGEPKIHWYYQQQPHELVVHGWDHFDHG